MAGSGGSDRRRLLVLGVAALLSISALLAIGILLFGRFGETEGKILGSTALLAACGVLALPGVVLLDRRQLRGLAVAVAALAAAGYALALVLIWLEPSSEWLGKAVTTTFLFAVASAQTAALAARRQERDPPSVRRLFPLSIGVALAAAGVLSGLIWADRAGAPARIAGALVVLDILAVALQPLLARARPVTVPVRLRALLDNGEPVELDVVAPDLATAAAKAIRSLERDGRLVVRVEAVDRMPAGKVAAAAREPV